MFPRAKKPKTNQTNTPHPSNNNNKQLTKQTNKQRSGLSWRQARARRCSCHTVSGNVLDRMQLVIGGWRLAILGFIGCLAQSLSFFFNDYFKPLFIPFFLEESQRVPPALMGPEHSSFIREICLTFPFSLFLLLWTPGYCILYFII